MLMYLSNIDSFFFYFSVIKMAGEDGTLTKENFTKILRSSDMFLKAFDKNKDGIVTEVKVKIKKC